MKRRIPELVAPAGSLATFLAGLESGADAFYFGIGRFNARARAQNIRVEELHNLVRAAREAGKKLYLALNILIRDCELEEVLGILERVEDCGLDAVIIQDLGLLDLIRTYFPSLSLHASTQMFLHNSLHVQALAARGVSRVILPRELSLQEIRQIRSKCPVQMEVFVHGALCFSFSGLCLASSYLLGASGNRGVCKQVCRFAFEGDAAKYPFSMRDLEGRTHLEALLTTGIEALKIEGRLRNADYVREVVAYYRRCLDDWATGNPLPKPPSRWRYGRDTTPGHMVPQSYERMVLGDREPWVGEHVGDVKIVSRGKARVSFHKKVFPGDRMRILREDGVKVREFTLLEAAGSRCEIEVRDRAGDRVNWKVCRVGTSRTPSARAMGRGAGRLKTCPVDLSIGYVDGILEIDALLQDRERFSASFPLQSRQEMNRLEMRRVQECFSRVDKAPFRIGQIEVSPGDPLAVPVRELNRIRREFFARLERFHDSRVSGRNEQRRRRILEALESIRREDIRKDTGAVLEVVPYEDFRRRGEEQGSGGRLWVELPLFVSEARLASFLKEISDLVEDASLGFVCPSLGWIDYLRSRLGADRVASGGFLYCLNGFAYRFLRDAGVSLVLLSPDFPPEDRRALLRFRKTAVARDPALRFFITRLRLPRESYRFRKWKLRAVRRTEYTEVVLAEPQDGFTGLAPCEAQQSPAFSES